MKHRLSWTLTTLLLILALVLPWAVLADDVDVDQIDATAANDPLALGDICAGKSKSGTAVFEIRRQGTGNKVFADGSTVTLSVLTTPSGVTASMTEDNTIILPSNWASLVNGTLSMDDASSEVTVTAGTVVGSYGAVVKYRATGKNGDNNDLTVDGNLNVTWTVISCEENEPPEVDAGGPYTGKEGEAINLDGDVYDADDDELTILWTYEVVAADEGAACAFADASAVDTTITCNDDGTFKVILTADDDVNDPVSDTANLTVSNVDPAITALSASPTSIKENESTKVSGKFTDPGTNDTHTVVIDWNSGGNAGGPGEGTTTLVEEDLTDCEDEDPATKCFSAEHQYLDDNPTGTASDVYTIKATVTDDDLGEGSATAGLTVNNVAPVVTITSPADGSVFAVNTPIDFVVEFTDPGTKDTWTCALTSGAGTYDPPCTSPYTFEDITFADAGIYNVTVTVTDDDGGTGSDTIMVVIYDPSAGFVTGGGWIDSPKDAYAPDPSLTGKATFGFVSKYLKGAKVPTGNTEFQFHAAGFNFHSTVYDWLVVSGSQAQYKGSGTVNGAGDYGFLLTAGDGTPDTFRLKVWDKNDGDTIVYDNGVNQPISSGSIIIHTGKK